MTTILVTGGTGSVGLAIAEALSAAGARVVLYAMAPPPVTVDAVRGRGAGPVELATGDIRDRARLDEVLARFAVDVVVHGAALTPDPAVELERPGDVLSVNCVGSLEVLQAARSAGVTRFVHLGSIASYGQSAVREALLVEDVTPDRPQNLYEISKSAGEKAVLRLGDLAGLDVVSLRLGDLFGRWEHPTGQRAVMSAVHQVTGLALRGESARLPRAGRKSWTYAADVGKAVSLLVAAPSWTHRTVNLASTHIWSVEDWCERLTARFPRFSYTVADHARPANVSMFADNAPMSPERLQEQLGWMPEFDIDAAFDDYMDWIADDAGWAFADERWTGPVSRPGDARSGPGIRR